MNLKEQIQQAQDLPEEAVTVPEWGGAALVIRGLTGTQRDEFEASCRKGDGKDVAFDASNLRAKLLVRCLYDGPAPAGKRVFEDDDAEILGGKSGKVLSRLAAKAQKLSGLTDADVEELAGNSGAAPSGASTSA